MTRQQDAERRLVEEVNKNLHPMQMLCPIQFLAIREAIAADPSLMEAFAPTTLSEHCAKAGIKLPTDMGENNG